MLRHPVPELTRETVAITMGWRWLSRGWSITGGDESPFPTLRLDRGVYYYLKF